MSKQPSEDCADRSDSPWLDDTPSTWRQILALIGRCVLGFFAGTVVYFVVFAVEVQTERGRMIQREMSPDEDALLACAITGMIVWFIAWGLKTGFLRRSVQNETLSETESNEANGGSADSGTEGRRSVGTVDSGTMFRAALWGAPWGTGPRPRAVRPSPSHVTDAPTPAPVGAGTMLRAAWWGAVLANVAIFPIAFLCALTIGIGVPFSGVEKGWDAALQSPFIILFYHLATLGFSILLLGGLGALAGTLYARFRARTVARQVIAAPQVPSEPSDVDARHLVSEPKTTKASPSATSGIGGAVVQAVVSMTVLGSIMSFIDPILSLTIPGAVVGYILAATMNLRRWITAFLCSWVFVVARVFVKTAFGNDIRVHWQSNVVLLAVIFGALVAFITNQVGRAVLAHKQRTRRP